MSVMYVSWVYFLSCRCKLHMPLCSDVSSAGRIIIPVIYINVERNEPWQGPSQTAEAAVTRDGVLPLARRPWHKRWWGPTRFWRAAPGGWWYPRPEPLTAGSWPARRSSRFHSGPPLSGKCTRLVSDSPNSQQNSSLARVLLPSCMQASWQENNFTW